MYASYSGWPTLLATSYTLLPTPPPPYCLLPTPCSLYPIYLFEDIYSLCNWSALSQQRSPEHSHHSSCPMAIWEMEL